MDEAALFTLLRTTDLPVAYHHYISPPSLPYIIYLVAEADAWGSDERNEVLSKTYLVELYSKNKDLASQRKIEAVFNERGIEYGLIEAYIESEGLYQAVYTIEFITKIGRD